MTQLLRLLVAAIALLNIAIGLAFLVAPARMAEQFFLQATSSTGLAALRADFTAFFLVGGLFAALGAWRTDPAPLRVPILLLVIALTGRTVSLVLDGVSPTAFPPMLAEATMIAVLLAASRAFARQ